MSGMIFAQREEMGDEKIAIEKENYNVSESIKKGKELILGQKEQLEAKKKTKEEIEKKAEEEAEAARQEFYEQKIVQETAPRAITTLERKLERERFRRELMMRAGREIKAPFKLRKSFSVRASETYDDNVFLTKVNQKKDYITKVSPSALFSMNSKYITFDINYVMDITRYKNNTGQSGTSHLLLTYIRPGSLALPFKKQGGKIGIEVQNDFQPFVTSVATSEQTERTDRTYNKFFLAVDYYMSAKRTLALEYTDTYQNYKTSSLQNFSYTESTISPMFYFHTTPKWSLFTGYDYGIMDYSTGTQDSTYQRLKGGVTGKIFTKVFTHFEAGKEWKEYKLSANGEAQKVFFKAAFLNKFTSSTMGSLQFGHTVEEATYTGNPYFVSDDLGVSIEHKLTYKTTGLLGVGYTHNAYDRATTEDGENKKREDNIWQPTVGLKYYIKKWITVDLEYTYKKRTSTFGKFDYVDNRIIGGLNVQF